VRQPLDVLAYSEMIPGAKRIAPKEVLKNPSVFPREQDVVIYCTCPGEKTSWEILKQAKSHQYTRIKLLRGGLAAWKAKGYAVEQYLDSFRLDTV
jgi:rhodanese-related sulfurtransferase